MKQEGSQVTHIVPKKVKQLIWGHGGFYGIFIKLQFCDVFIYQCILTWDCLCSYPQNMNSVRRMTNTGLSIWLDIWGSSKTRNELPVAFCFDSVLDSRDKGCSTTFSELSYLLGTWTEHSDDLCPGSSLWLLPIFCDYSWQGPSLPTGYGKFF